MSSTAPCKLHHVCVCACVCVPHNFKLLRGKTATCSPSSPGCREPQCFAPRLRLCRANEQPRTVPDRERGGRQQPRGSEFILAESGGPDVCPALLRRRDVGQRSDLTGASSISWEAGSGNPRHNERTGRGTLEILEGRSAPRAPWPSPWASAELNPPRGFGVMRRFTGVK